MLIDKKNYLMVPNPYLVVQRKDSQGSFFFLTQRQVKILAIIFIVFCLYFSLLQAFLIIFNS